MSTFCLCSTKRHRALQGENNNTVQCLSNGYNLNTKKKKKGIMSHTVIVIETHSFESDGTL